MVRPPRLKAGDLVGIVSPSWGGAGRFPHRTARGVAQLEALGFRVVVGRHAMNIGSHVSDTPENRAADLHELFADPEVRAIIAAIGGDHACHLLPLLDFDLIRQNPKVFIGYSDITVLNVAINHRTGLVTFNGPALLTDFAEHPAMFEYAQICMLKVLANPQPAGTIQPAPAWTEEMLDWGTQKDCARPRRMTPSPGWTWLKPGRAEGTLLGGCIESLQHLRGTRYWPDWQGRLFFWETSEDKPSPESIDGILMDYENMGIFDRIQGMLVGRPVDYSDTEKQALREVILERTRRYHFPIITDMDFGHTAPQMTLPVGVRAVIDSQARTFTLVDPAVA